MLPADEYDDEHLPGALHLPLKELDDALADARLDGSQPVIVYCWEAL